MKNKSYFGDKCNKVKLYKKGKFWIAAAITFLTMSLGKINTVDIHADMLNATTQDNTGTSTSSSAVTKSSQPDNKTTVATESSSQTNNVSNSTATKSSQPDNKTTAAAVTEFSSQTHNISSNNVSVPTTTKTLQIDNTITTSSQVDGTSGSMSSKDTQIDDASNLLNTQNGSTTEDSNKENDNNKDARSLQPLNLRVINDASVSDPNSNNKTMYNSFAVNNATSFASTSDYYGVWTFFFQDENGAMLNYPEGISDATSTQAKNYVTPIVENIENDGYKYDYAQIYHSYIGNYSYNYITLIFSPSPLVKGGAVSVQYVDSSTGKVLQTGTATYKDRAQNVTTTPYVGCDYTTKPISIPGYTLTTTPDNATGKITNSTQTVTYKYSPNQETAQIQIIDDSENGKLIDSVAVDGTYGSTSTYDINSYLSSKYANYNVESNNWPGSITWSSSNDGTVPVYQVKLTHKTQTGTDTKNVTQTINYQYINGKTALPSKVTTITFTRSKTTDLVTGETTYGTWTNTTGQTEFPSVTSPQMTGYTPSYNQTQDVTGITADSSDNTQTIVYVPNKEVMNIVYYDMDEQKVLKEDTLQGDYGTSPSYDYQSIIQGYENEGYNVAKDTIPTSGLTFDNTGNQQYEVDLSHTKIKLPADSQGLTGVITRVIHYVDTNGKTMASDVVQKITFTRGATQDKVTGAISYTDWQTTTNPTEFPSVDSPNISGYTPSETSSGTLPVSVDFPSTASVDFPTYNKTIVYTKNAAPQNPTAQTTTVTETINYLNDQGVSLSAPTKLTVTFTKNADGTYSPVGSDDFPSVTPPTIAGYTPNVSTIPEVDNVQATDANINKVVIYSPQSSQIIITYYDKTLNKSITANTLIGTYNTSPNYDPNTEISILEKKGYKEVSSTLPSSLLYSSTVQSFVINFEHTYTTTTQNATVTQQINYKYANGDQAAESVNKQLSFSRTETQDNVTGKITDGTWSPTSGDFPSVVSPTITGYTPTELSSQEITNVDGSTTNNVQNIIYNANQETIDVNFIDQTTGKLIKTVPVVGSYGSNATYSTTNDIETLEKSGYELVQDNYPSGVKFDVDGTVKTFTVIMKENIIDSTQSKTINQTIHYVDSNGKTLAPDKTTSVTFTRNIEVNEVTGKQTDGSWSPSTSSFPQVQSPTITGYTVVAGENESKLVNLDPDTSTDDVQTITYTPNQEKAEVQFVDQTTNKVLSTVDLTGAYGTYDSYNPATTIENYINKGYKLSLNNFPPTGVVYNFDGTVPVYTINFTHNIRTDTVDNNPDNLSTDELSHTVTRTINYVYSNGKTAADSVVNSVTFTRSAQVDQVTKQIVSEGNWTPINGTYPAETSPTITGYTPNVSTVATNTSVSPTDTDKTITVTYTANPEHAVVNYVDDATGKTVASQTVNGTFGSSTTYDPSSEENTLKSEGYTVGSSDLPTDGNITFSKDGDVPTYTVHLNEGTTTYTPSDNPEGLELTHTVNQTIHYVYSDGKTAATDVKYPVVFHRNAIKDNVTGNITYTNWTTDTSGKDSPVISGYTPSKKVSDVSSVKVDNPNNTETIIYTANPEHAIVNYVDDTDGGKIVHSDTVNGHFDETSNYDPTSEETTLKNQGYVVGNSDLPTDGNITFTKDGDVPTYTVHLTHGTTTVNSNNSHSLDKKYNQHYEVTRDVTRTIKYQNSNGSTVASSVIDTVHFVRTAKIDAVTGRVISYGKWQVEGTDVFPGHVSPNVNGYTPDQENISSENNITADMQDQTIIVTYKAKPKNENVINNYIGFSKHSYGNDLNIKSDWSIHNVIRSRTNKNALPMTGADDHIEGTMSIIGLTLADVLIMFGLSGAYRKQKVGDLTREEDFTTGKK